MRRRRTNKNAPSNGAFLIFQPGGKRRGLLFGQQALDAEGAGHAAGDKSQGIQQTEDTGAGAHQVGHQKNKTGHSGGAAAQSEENTHKTHTLPYFPTHGKSLPFTSTIYQTGALRVCEAVDGK